jgi:hypothetical protein
LAKLRFDVDAPSVSSYTGTIGGLLRDFFGVDADVVFALVGSIVLYNSSL